MVGTSRPVVGFHKRPLLLTTLRKSCGEPYSGPYRETDQNRETVEAKRAVGAVLAVVEKGALVEVPDGSGTVRAARAAVMEDLDLR